MLSLGELAVMGGFCFCALGIAGIVRMVMQRLNWEEDVMEKEFEQEWKAYTRKVRWKVVPGVL